MNYFLTVEDVQNGCKVLLKNRIVTAIELSGRNAKLAEDGKWYSQLELRPLAQDQLRDELIDKMSAFCQGKSIVTLVAEGKGVQFVLEDNTRVGLDITATGDLKLSVVNADGRKVI